MSNPLPISTWIEWAKIAQYLSTNDNSSNRNFGGWINISPLPRLLYLTRTAIENVFNNNPNDPTLYQTATYLYQLIGTYATAAQNIIANQNLTLPVLSGPQNMTTTAGVPVTFSVTVLSGSSPISFQWYFGGQPIIGATSSSYTVTNPQPSSSAQIYTVSATNPAGSVLSQQATLTVTTGLSGSLYYTTTDPGPILRSGSNPFNYQETFPITSGQPWTIPLPSGATPFMYLVMEGPQAEPIKTTYFNTSLNSGAIPNSAFQSPVIIGGSRIYYTRVPVSFDTTKSLVLT